MEKLSITILKEHSLIPVMSTMFKIMSDLCGKNHLSVLTDI